MKKLNFLSLALIATLPFMQSCNDNTPSEPRYIAWTTVNVTGTSYDFTTDIGQSIFPGDVSQLMVPYETRTEDGYSKDGNRVLLLFEKLPTLKPGFDMNANMLVIADIPSDDIKTVENQIDYDELADDYIFIVNAQSSGNWVDIECAYSRDGDNVHNIKLIDPTFELAADDAPKNVPEGYKYLELRHENVEEDNKIASDMTHSFRLNELLTDDLKGFYIRYREADKSIKYFKAEYLRPTVK